MLLDGDPAEVAHRLGRAAADVIIDYLWGGPTTAAMAAVVTARAARGRPLTWIEVGSVARPTAAIPSAALPMPLADVARASTDSAGTNRRVVLVPKP